MRSDFYMPDMLRREASEWASQPKAKDGDFVRFTSGGRQWWAGEEGQNAY